MNIVSSLAAFGIWPALPLSGYWLLIRNYRPTGADSLPRVTSFALMTVAGIAVWSGPILAAAAIGVYRAEAFGLVGWAVTLFALIRLIKRRDGLSHASVKLKSWDWVLTAGIVAAALLYLGFPTESILGWRDEGVYTNHGIYIARHGRLDVPYPWPEDAAALFFQRPVKGARIPSFLPGFYRTEPTMTVQFGHLFPVWLAQAFSTLGHHGLFRLNGMFALLSMMMFYGVCRSVLPKPYAVVTTLFLALNPSQIWAARITLAEILTQLFIWSGLLLLGQALKSDNRMPARWGGIFLGLSAMVRIDSFLLVPLLFLSHLAHRIIESPVRHRSLPVWFAFYQTALPVFALAVGWYALFSTPYFRDLYPFVRQIGLAAAISILALIAFTAGISRRIAPWLTSRVTLLLIGIALVGLTAYAYWIRPHIGSTSLPHWLGRVLPAGPHGYHHDSLVNLARYLSPLVIWTAVLGWLTALCLLARKGWDSQFVPALIIVGGVSTFYISNPYVSADHFWAIRRFVPVIIPGFVCFGAIGLSWAMRKLSARWSMAMGGLVLAYLAVFTIRADALILTFAENRGLFTQLQALAKRLPNDTVVFAHGPATWTTPFLIAFDRRIIPLYPNVNRSRKAATKWISSRADEQNPAYLAYEGDLPLVGLKHRLIDQAVLSRAFVERSTTPLPRRIRTSRNVINIVEITGMAEGIDYRKAAFGAASIIGVEESGFHQEGAQVRWTNGAARLVVPLVGQPPPRALRIALAATGPLGADLQLLVNGRTLFKAHLPAGAWFNTFGFAGMPLGERVTIDVLSDTFVPKNLLNTNDFRTLGVLVQGIWLLEKEPPFSDKPLPSNGYRSQVKLKEQDTRIRVSAGQTIPLRLIVRNLGNATWPTPADLGYYTGGVRVGILWFARGRTDGRLAEQRAELPRAMVANDRQEVDAVLRPIGYDGTPLAPGRYEVWISLIQEQVAWFYSKGDAVLKLAVEVTP